MEIFTELLDSAYVDTHRDEFNSTNHWLEHEGRAPADFDMVVNRQHNTCTWVDAFHRDYQVINISAPRHLAWLCEAADTAQLTGRFPQTYRDELQEFLHEYRTVAVRPNSFVRTEHVSLKTGCHGVGPYNDLQSIIESAVTSRASHRVVRAAEVAAPIKFYLLPWQSRLCADLEFRAFVHADRMTAITQQHWNRPNARLRALDDDSACHRTMNDWAARIFAYWHTTVVPVMASVSHSYTMDIALLPPQEDGSTSLTPYFIEVNAFGKEYAAGSGLFHWLRDEALLYSRSGNRCCMRCAM